MSNITDPIADMLTRMRNAIQANKGEVEIPSSKLKLSIIRILKQEGYIQQHKLIKDGKQGIIKIIHSISPQCNLTANRHTSS